MSMDLNLVLLLALAALLALGWWYARRRTSIPLKEAVEERVDTLAAWPPEPTRIMRTTERVAYSTLKLALPGYMILAQVPIARFVSVPKRNSYAEWMRRLGSQCVDFVICDVTSQVIAVVDVRPPVEQMSVRLRVRLDRVERTLAAARIPLHVFTEDALPSVDGARARILPDSPAVPSRLLPHASVAGAAGGARATAAAGAASHAREPSTGNPFEQTDRDWSTDEVIEVSDPSSSTWFDELEPVTPTLPVHQAG